MLVDGNGRFPEVVFQRKGAKEQRGKEKTLLLTLFAIFAFILSTVLCEYYAKLDHFRHVA